MDCKERRLAGILCRVWDGGSPRSLEESRSVWRGEGKGSDSVGEGVREVSRMSKGDGT